MQTTLIAHYRLLTDPKGERWAARKKAREGRGARRSGTAMPLSPRVRVKDQAAADFWFGG